MPTKATEREVVLTLTQIAKEIDGYLDKFFKDHKVNVRDSTYKTLPYYFPSAIRTGAYIRVCYVTYQGGTNLTRSEAQAYLDWLKAGNVGKHWAMSQEKKNAN